MYTLTYSKQSLSSAVFYSVIKQSVSYPVSIRSMRI